VLRNVISNARMEVVARPESSVRQVVDESGFMGAGTMFSVRAKDGRPVDDEEVWQHADTVLSVGLPGDGLAGG
jgi:hypothetical protein